MRDPESSDRFVSWNSRFASVTSMVMKGMDEKGVKSKAQTTAHTKRNY